MAEGVSLFEGDYSIPFGISNILATLVVVLLFALMQS